MADRTRVLRIYGKLLALYPKDFRDRLASSMEQTFDDQVRERRADGRPLVPFLAWAFAETALGIVRERARRAKGVTVVAAIVGFLLVLPLMTLEWATYRPGPRTGFHIAWFGYLWLLAVLFIRTSVRTVRMALAMTTGSVVVLRSISLVLRLAFLGLLAWSWASLVIDQMPCFVGGSGC